MSYFIQQFKYSVFFLVDFYFTTANTLLLTGLALRHTLLRFSGLPVRPLSAPAYLPQPLSLLVSPHLLLPTAPHLRPRPVSSAEEDQRRGPVTFLR